MGSSFGSLVGYSKISKYGNFDGGFDGKLNILLIWFLSSDPLKDLYMAIMTFHFKIGFFNWLICNIYECKY